MTARYQVLCRFASTTCRDGRTWPNVVVVDDSESAFAASTMSVQFARGPMSPRNFNSARRSIAGRAASWAPDADEAQPLGGTGTYGRF